MVTSRGKVSTQPGDPVALSGNRLEPDAQDVQSRKCRVVDLDLHVDRLPWWCRGERAGSSVARPRRPRRRERCAGKTVSASRPNRGERRLPFRPSADDEGRVAPRDRHLRYQPGTRRRRSRPACGRRPASRAVGHCVASSRDPGVIPRRISVGAVRRLAGWVEPVAARVPGRQYQGPKPPMPQGSRAPRPPPGGLRIWSIAICCRTASLRYLVLRRSG